ncbi:MAG: hypothetical protein AseanaTS_03220 [Candidatus Pelagadaptatus aseana]|uniref:BLUF domain-containing protein n=1 Tax=Candidatus Pelagadaptatus aseana TaxID=3120508 RepID=UPI0039B14D68
MHRILYVSTPAPNLTITEVEDIVARSRVKNHDCKVTGFLCGSSRFFIQCIEGEQTDIENLFDMIKHDGRHHNVQVLHQGPCDSRMFSNWDMGVVLYMDRHQKIIDRYTVGQSFNPYTLEPEQCLNLLMDFSKLKNDF